MKLKSTAFHSLFVLIMLSLGLSSQHGQRVKDFTIIRQTKLSLTSTLNQPLKLVHDGKELLQSYPVPGGEFSFQLYRHWTKNTGVNFGFGYAFSSYNVNYNIETPENSIFLTGDYIEAYRRLDGSAMLSFHHLFTIPLTIQKTFKVNQDKYRTLELGVRLNSMIFYPFDFEFGSLYSINDSTTYRLLSTEFSTERRHVVSVMFKAGIIKLQGNKNTIQLNGVLNYGFNHMSAGSYEFSNLGIESSGKIYQNINYVGLELVYAFTKKYVMPAKYFSPLQHMCGENCTREDRIRRREERKKSR